MSKIQGVEIFNIEKDESLILGKLNKDTIPKIGNNITRRVVTTGLRIPEFKGLPLSAILNNVDCYFDILSQSIGGRTVNHTWYLIPTSLSYWELKQIGIEGHMLGTQTEVVKGNKIKYAPKGSLYDVLQSKLRETSSEFLDRNGWYIADAAKPHQFMLDEDTSARPVLVDIEPRIETSTYPPPEFDLL